MSYSPLDEQDSHDDMAEELERLGDQVIKAKKGKS